MLSSYTGAGKAQVLLTKNLGGHHQSLSGKKSEVIPMSMCGEIKKAEGEGSRLRRSCVEDAQASARDERILVTTAVWLIHILTLYNCTKASH